MISSLCKWPFVTSFSETEYQRFPYSGFPMLRRHLNSAKLFYNWFSNHPQNLQNFQSSLDLPRLWIWKISSMYLRVWLYWRFPSLSSCQIWEYEKLGLWHVRKNVHMLSTGTGLVTKSVPYSLLLSWKLWGKELEQCQVHFPADEAEHQVKTSWTGNTTGLHSRLLL